MKKSEVTKRWNDVSFVADAKAALERVLVAKQAATAVDLRGIKIGLDGVPIGFEVADFLDATLIGSDASFAQFSCSFARANLQNSIFVQAVFDTCDFKNTRLSECDFSESRINSPTLDDAIFSSCKFVNARISGRGLNEYGGRRVTFSGCDFTDAVIQNLQLRAVTFEDCTFDRAVFKKCYLAGVKVNGTPIGKESFEGCHVQSLSVNGFSVTEAGDNF